MKKLKIVFILFCSMFLFGFNNDFGINSLEVENYSLNFNPEVVIYNIVTKGEDKLIFNYDLLDGASVDIIGNENLVPGSVININLKYKNINRTYKVNIAKEKTFTYDEIKIDNSVKFGFKSILSLLLIIISIIEILLLIYVIKKKI